MNYLISLKQSNMTNVVRFPNGKYAYIDESLEPPILQHLEERGLTYYVRINPNYVDDKPYCYIKEKYGGLHPLNGKML